MNYFATILFILFSSFMYAQDVTGTIAQDFELQDINGETHKLYEVLAEGKTVFLDVMTTWCGPCWNFHETGTFKELYNLYGPEGTDELMIFMLEIDQLTTLDQLYGTPPRSAGDFVDGTPYPIIDGSDLGNIYQVLFIPTLFKICPDRIMEKINILEVQDYYDMVLECPSIETTPEPIFKIDASYGCESLEVQFDDNSWPAVETWQWDFGDGQTSVEASPIHNYEESGTYDVTLKVSNSYGETEKVFESIITVDSGSGQHESMMVGYSAPDMNSGSWRGHGNRGLFFDVESPVIIESVAIEAQDADEREFVVWDRNNNIIASKKVWLEEGPARVDLEFHVPPGNDYLLTCLTDANMKYSTSDVAFPYEIDGLLSITESFFVGNPTAEYYFFYDWSVRAAGCSESVSTKDLKNTGISLHPNPVSDILYMNDVEHEKIEVYNTSGELTMTVDGTHKNVDVTHLPQGVYILKGHVGDKMLYEKFIKQ